MTARRTVNEIKKEQEDRMAKRPDNCIAFRLDWNVAADDQRNMRRWLHGEISIHALCRLIAESNHLPYVTEEQMRHELGETGWL